jgi:hypothetical protein
MVKHVGFSIAKKDKVKHFDMAKKVTFRMAGIGCG